MAQKETHIGEENSGPKHRDRACKQRPGLETEASLPWVCYIGWEVRMGRGKGVPFSSKGGESLFSSLSENQGGGGAWRGCRPDGRQVLQPPGSSITQAQARPLTLCVLSFGLSFLLCVTGLQEWLPRRVVGIH